MQSNRAHPWVFLHPFPSLSVNNHSPGVLVPGLAQLGRRQSSQQGPRPQGVFSGFGQPNKPLAMRHNELTGSGRESWDGHPVKKENQGRLPGGGDAWFTRREQSVCCLAEFGFGTADHSSDSRNACGWHSRREESPTQTTHLRSDKWHCWLKPLRLFVVVSLNYHQFPYFY